MSTTLSETSVDRADTRPPRTRAGRWWLDAPVRQKVLGIVLLVALICLPPIVAGVVLDAQLDDARADTRSNLDAIDDLRSLRTSLLDADNAFQFYGTDGGFASPDYVEDFRTAADAIPAQIEAVQDALPDDLAPAGREVAQRSEAMIDQIGVLFGFGAAGTEPADVQDDPGLFELNPALVDELTVALETSPTAFAAIDELARQLDEMLAQSRAEVDRLQERFVWVMLASLAAALLGAAGGAFVVTSGILRRVDQLTESGEQFLRTGELATTTRSADEIGRLTEKILVVAEMLDDRRKEATAATRTKDEFLSRVSHELKTPLSAMIELGSELEGDAELSPESRDDAAHIASAGDHLRALVDELLDIKAIEVGQLSIAIEPVSVDETASDAITLIRTMPAARSITVLSDCPVDAVVAADRRRLREVLLNLLSNAVKYNRADGRVDLTARRRDGTVRVAVRDTGPGISATDQERLFQPFERLAADHTDVEGSGVGLAVTKRVVEAMGGTIGVDSEVGRGSTFWFDLPAGDAPRSSDRPVPLPATPLPES
jgi:signal transduction histidine kinase